jgi:DtxR family Mn-dependent transcriptional regulator
MSKEKYLSEAVENYLKAIYYLSQEDKEASTQRIAAHLGVSNPGVTKMLHYLSKHRLILYTPYQPVTLTPLGEKIALELIRHHRLIELYLMKGLGYGWERVHEEAERLEHHISEEFEASIERLLGFPKFDPHGDPIPTRDGRLPPLVTQTLDAQAVGALSVVRRVTDEDAALLLYLGEKGLHPGAEVRLLGREPFGGSLRVEIAGREQQVSPQAARNVFVEPATSVFVSPHRTESLRKEETSC